MAVAQKTGIPKWVTLGSGNMDQNLQLGNPSCLILSHTHILPTKRTSRVPTTAPKKADLSFAESREVPPQLGHDVLPCHLRASPS